MQSKEHFVKRFITICKSDIRFSDFIVASSEQLINFKSGTYLFRLKQKPTMIHLERTIKELQNLEATFYVDLEPRKCTKMIYVLTLD